MIGDKGFWGREYKQRLAAAGTTLLTPDKTRNAANQGRARALASTRLVIESVFSNLKEQMRPSDTSPAPQPDSPCGSPQRILALTIGMLLNTLNGRPARALAAYDGRLNYIKPLVGGADSSKTRPGYDFAGFEVLRFSQRFSARRDGSSGWWRRVKGS